jgi:hypothetical protein
VAEAVRESIEPGGDGSLRRIGFEGVCGDEGAKFLGRSHGRLG